MANKVVDKITQKKRRGGQTKANPEDLKPVFQTPAGVSDLPKFKGGPSSTSNLQSIPGVTPAIPKKPETVKPKSGKELIQAVEKAKSLAAEAEGRSGVGASKNAQKNATAQALQEQNIRDSQESGEITVEEANKRLSEIAQGSEDLLGQVNDPNEPTSGQIRGESFESIGEVAFTIAPIVIASIATGGAAALVLGGVLSTSIGGAVFGNEAKEVAAAGDVFTRSTTGAGGIDQTIGLARSGQMPPEVAFVQMQRNLESINQAERALKIMIAGDPIAAHTTKAKQQLAEITAYKKNFETYILPTLQQALLEGSSVRLSQGLVQ